MRQRIVIFAMCLFGLVGAAWGQAPTHAPSPEELWAYRGGRVVKMEPSELWGDMYCSGGYVRRYQSPGCCPLFSCIGAHIRGALSCLVPCHSGCATKAGCETSCCSRPLFPSVRFHNPSCCDGGVEGGDVIYESQGPTLIEPPVPSPDIDTETLPPSTYYRRGNSAPVRSATSRLVRPIGQKKKSTGSSSRTVSHQEPAASSARRSVPSNPLRR